MKLRISIKDLQIAFDSIKFIPKTEDRDVVTISHPHFRDDGHKIPIVFKRGLRNIWQLETDITIVKSYE